MKCVILFLILSFGALGQDFTFDKEKGKAVPTFIGQAKLIKGSVFKKTADSSLTPVETGTRFKTSEGVITKERSFLKIQLIDDTIISIGPKSEIKLDEYDFTDKENRSFLFSLIRGQMTGDIKNKAPADQLKFKTKFTTMGIRGTYVLVNTQTKNSLEVSQFALLSGKAQLSAGVDKYDLASGDHLVIVSGDSLTEKEKRILSGEEINKLSAEEIDETKDFKPFLPYLDLNDETNSLMRKHFQHTSSSDIGEIVVNKREEKKPSWQQNLKKLNQKLKENQKKKP
jgi:hypothetical protein